VLPCGIGHVYDNEHSYPTPNADIGMILRRGDFWTLDGRRTGKPALAKKDLRTKTTTIDPSSAEWIEGIVSGNIQMACSTAKNWRQFCTFVL